MNNEYSLFMWHNEVYSFKHLQFHLLVKKAIFNGASDVASFIIQIKFVLMIKQQEIIVFLLVNSEETVDIAKSYKGCVKRSFLIAIVL